MFIAMDNEKHFMIYGKRYDKPRFHFQKLSNAIDGGQGFSRVQSRALSNLLKEDMGTHCVANGGFFYVNNGIKSLDQGVNQLVDGNKQVSQGLTQLNQQLASRLSSENIDKISMLCLTISHFT